MSERHLPAHPHTGHPAPYNPYGPPAFNPNRLPMFPNIGALMPNPEGLAATGAIIGNLLGTGIGWVISAASLSRPPETVDLLVEDATAEEAQQAVAQQTAELLEAWASYRRKAHAINAATATLGAAVGAYVGASPHQAHRAAMGAAIGAGTVRLVNVAANPWVGLPGWVAGGLGAYIGAKGARPSAPGYPAPRTV